LLRPDGNPIEAATEDLPTRFKMRLEAQFARPTAEKSATPWGRQRDGDSDIF
jgi:hypothetical protein